MSLYTDYIDEKTRMVKHNLLGVIKQYVQIQCNNDGALERSKGYTTLEEYFNDQSTQRVLLAASLSKIIDEATSPALIEIISKYVRAYEDKYTVAGQSPLPIDSIGSLIESFVVSKIDGTYVLGIASTVGEEELKILGELEVFFNTTKK